MSVQPRYLRIGLGLMPCLFDTSAHAVRGLQALQAARKGLLKALKRRYCGYCIFCDMSQFTTPPLPPHPPPPLSGAQIRSIPGGGGGVLLLRNPNFGTFVRLNSNKLNYAQTLWSLMIPQPRCHKPPTEVRLLLYELILKNKGDDCGFL